MGSVGALESDRLPRAPQFGKGSPMFINRPLWLSRLPGTLRSLLGDHYQIRHTGENPMRSAEMAQVLGIVEDDEPPPDRLFMCTVASDASPVRARDAARTEDTITGQRTKARSRPRRGIVGCGARANGAGLPAVS